MLGLVVQTSECEWVKWGKSAGVGGMAGRGAEDVTNVLYCIYVFGIVIYIQEVVLSAINNAKTSCIPVVLNYIL